MQNKAGGPVFRKWKLPQKKRGRDIKMTRTEEEHRMNSTEGFKGMSTNK